MTAQTKMIEDKLIMQGTSGGFDYLVVAQRGKFLLGVKPEHVEMTRDGIKTRIGFRIRCEAGEYEQGSVVSLADKHLAAAKAFPELQLTQHASGHASDTISTLLLGSIGYAPEKLSSSLEKISVGYRLWQFLTAKVDAEELVVSQEVCVKWVDGVLNPVLQQLQLAIEAKKQAEQSMQDNEGVFQLDSQVLSKAFKKAQNAQGNYEAEDLDDDNDD